MLVHLIVSWLVGALALWIVARIVEGIYVRNFGDALIATAVIAVLDYTVRPILRILGAPITWLTFGLFLLVINAFVLLLASMLTPGFKVRGFLNALLGSILLSILTYLLTLVI